MPVRVGWLQREEDPRALRPLRRGRELHRALQARDARARPRAALVPGDAGQGEGRRSRDRRAHRAGLRGQELPPRRPLHRARRGHRVDQRVGQRARRRAPSASRCAATRRPTSRTSTCRAACSSRWASTPSPGLPFEERVQFLGNVLKGTTPRRRSWLEQIEKRPQRGALRGAARARSTPSSAGPPACACTSPAATARTRAGSTSPAWSPAPASTSPSSRCRCCGG